MWLRCMSTGEHGYLPRITRFLWHFLSLLSSQTSGSDCLGASAVAPICPARRRWLWCWQRWRTNKQTMICVKSHPPGAVVVGGAPLVLNQTRRAAHRASWTRSIIPAVSRSCRPSQRSSVRNHRLLADDLWRMGHAPHRAADQPWRYGTSSRSYPSKKTSDSKTFQPNTVLSITVINCVH